MTKKKMALIALVTLVITLIFIVIVKSEILLRLFPTAYRIAVKSEF